MSERLAVSDVQFTSASKQDRARGLEGYVALVIGGALRIDGISVRRLESGALSLSFPSRRDRFRHRHPIAAPVDAGARRAIESQVFAELADVLPKERI